MRKNFNGLYGLVRYHLGCDPESGHVFLFAMRVATVSNFWYMTEAAYGFARRS